MFWSIYWMVVSAQFRLYFFVASLLDSEFCRLANIFTSVTRRVSPDTTFKMS
jgi:hypothetical protein